MTTEAPNIVAAAQARRNEITKLIAALTQESRDLDSFLQTAARIQAQLGLSAPKPAQEGPPRKATRKDVVSAAVKLIRRNGGQPVSTGKVVEDLIESGIQIGNEGSSASSIVSANLSAAPEIDRNPDGPGWVESEAGKLL